MYKKKIGNAGYVDFVCKGGDDRLAATSARVSYGKQGDELTEGKTRNFLTSLSEMGHETPFEHCSITVDVKVPIVVARQWMRHRTGKYNEYSGRYSEMKPDFYLPGKFRVKNGAEWSDEMDGKALAILTSAYDAAYDAYRKLLAMGVVRELARLVLPLGTYTEFRWTIDLRNLFHFLDLRLDVAAQEETRDYALAIYETLPKLFPAASAAYRRSRGLEDGYIPSIRRPKFCIGETKTTEKGFNE